MRCILLVLIAVLVSHAAPVYKVAVFTIDATPDAGEPNIWVQPATVVLDPLLGKGIVLDDGAHRYVIAAIDWCGIGSSIHAMLRSRMAVAAGTIAARVALQSLHQHTAPYVDGDGYRLLEERHIDGLRMSNTFLEKLAARLERSIRDAVSHLEPFDQVGSGKARVERVASARRILKDGRILVRFSTTAKTPELADEPEGDIDSELRTVTLARGTRPIVRLHYYATHPQTFCCDGRVTSDFAGAARERFEKEEGIPQIYFTGCAGNVTVGKYNHGKDTERQELADRLYNAMKESSKSTRYERAAHLQWRYLPLTLPVRTDLPDIDRLPADAAAQYRAAITIAFAAKGAHPLPACALRIGNVVLIHLPGEPFVEFQRFAQESADGRFVAVAGYGDISPGYLCTDLAFQQGGYEPGASNAAPGTEARVKQLIGELLAP